MIQEIKIDELTAEIINKILKSSKTKIINPVAFLASLNFLLRDKKIFTRKELDEEYKQSVKEVKNYTKSDLNIGGRFHSNTYPDRMASKYGAFVILPKNKLKLPDFIINQDKKRIQQIKQILLDRILDVQKIKIGNLQLIDQDSKRIKIAKEKNQFINFLTNELKSSANGFEITCFAILKVFLEKFACKLYRNSRTNARDSGIDISTNFGVAYQVKKFKLKEEKEVNKILKEIKTNFDKDRIQDGKLVLVLEDIDSNFKHLILGKNIKMFKLSEILKFAEQIEEVEDKMKVLRVIYEENKRELKSDI